LVGWKAALARAHSKAASRPLARKASSGLALKLRLSPFGMQSGQKTNILEAQNQG
jgi:hypothetical protein